MVDIKYNIGKQTRTAVAGLALTVAAGLYSTGCSTTSSEDYNCWKKNPDSDGPAHIIAEPVRHPGPPKEYPGDRTRNQGKSDAALEVTGRLIGEAIPFLF